MTGGGRRCSGLPAGDELLLFEFCRWWLSTPKIKGPFRFALHSGGVGQTALGATTPTTGRCLASSGVVVVDALVGVCGKGRFAKSGSMRLL